MTKSISSRLALQILPLAGLAVCVLLAVWGYRAGLLTDESAMADFVARCGIWGIVFFTAFQMVQVVLPILPGGLGCLLGVVLFGPVRGFLCSYIGICAGSMLAFLIAKTYGRPLLPRLFSPKTIEKYERWTDGKSRFAALFALAIFLPVAPDDFLCYLAGTTEMSFRKFTAIIWSCKPFAIAAYSLCLTAAWGWLAGLLSGL